MLIYDSKKKINNKIKNSKINIFFKVYFFSTIVIFLFATILFFNSIFWKTNQTRIFSKLDEIGIMYYSKLPYYFLNGIKGKFINTNIINLSINFKNYSILSDDAKNKLDAYKNNVIEWPIYNFREVPAELKLDNEKKIRISIRLKGDRPIHYIQKDNFSYKIKIKKGKSILGMNEFSLIKPRARNYTYEWIFHKLLEENNLINLKYIFMKLKINGENKGLYVLEESFDKLLIENNKKRDGPIFSLNENLDFNLHNSSFEHYNKKFWNRDKKNQTLLNIAQSKLYYSFLNEGKFISNNLEEFFDYDAWAKYFAIIDLMQAPHGAYPKSVKFYYNTLTGKFEPIGFDAHYVKRKFDKNINKINDDLLYEIYKSNNFPQHQDMVIFLSKFFEDENFTIKYLNQLKKLSDENYIKNFYEKNQSDINEINKLIYSDYFFADRSGYFGPGLFNYESDLLHKRANVIKRKLKIYNEKIHAYFKNDTLLIKDNNINNLSKPIAIVCDKIEITSFEKKIIKFKNIFDQNRLVKEINYPNINSCSQIMFKDKISGNEFVKEIYKINHGMFRPLKSYEKSLYLEYFDLKDNNVLNLKKDLTKIKENILIPKGFNVVIKPGQSIFFENYSIIFSLSNWNVGHINGDNVLISGGNISNGGLFINSKKQSNFYNVNFENLSGVYGNQKKNILKIEKLNLSNYDLNFNITGAIAFFDGKVEMKECSFNNIDSEDSINIVNSKLLLKNISFDNSKSDAVDIDYSEGLIENLKFTNIGNDALDFSGSNLLVKNIKILNADDKGISVGENAIVTLENIKVSNSKVGIATKDGSNVKVKNIYLNKNTYDIAVYQKKTFYNNAVLEIYNLKNKSYKYLLDNKSILKIEEKIFDTNMNTKKINSLLYN